MNCVERTFRALLAATLIFAVELGQATTIARVKVDALFKEADLVAIVKVLSGDAEHYQAAVYKAEVLMAFKGTAAKAKVFFGPYVGSGVGSEYVVFLRKSKSEMKPTQGTADSPYGTISVFYEVMYSGFSIMESDYECVFDGKEISQQCDYGVKLNPEQVILPADVKTFPAGDAGPLTNYDKWVRKSAFIDLLKQEDFVPPR